MTKGKVYLVGGGPGDPGLLTIKGAECLRKADYVVYDALSNPDFVNMAPERAKKFYVGKRGAVHAMEQEDINALLVRLGKEFCKKGKPLCSVCPLAGSEVI